MTKPAAALLYLMNWSGLLAGRQRLSKVRACVSAGIVDASDVGDSHLRESGHTDAPGHRRLRERDDVPLRLADEPADTGGHSVVLMVLSH
jgi:hypothetical protein